MDKPYILIAEDNSGDVSLLRMALAEEGVTHDIIVKTDGEYAMDFLTEVEEDGIGHPALAILDLNLPKVSGREVLERIRKAEGYGQIPVVMFSSSDSERDRKDAMDLGATHHVRKPSNLDDFLQVGKLLKSLLGA